MSEFAVFRECKCQSCVAPWLFGNINPTLSSHFKIFFHHIQHVWPRICVGHLILGNFIQYSLILDNLWVICLFNSKIVVFSQWIANFRQSSFFRSLFKIVFFILIYPWEKKSIKTVLTKTAVSNAVDLPTIKTGRGMDTMSLIELIIGWNFGVIR